MALLSVSSTVLMGVRQGNPISPFLFVIVMEALSRMISVSIDNGFLSSFSMGSRLPELVNVSYLLFAYDPLVFCGANSDHVHSLRALFICYEVVLGLKVNMAKSVTMDNMGDLASILSCGTSSLPLKYLGLPLMACFKAKSIWDCIVEKIERRLVSWKMMYLPKGGRVTLIIIIMLIGNINIYKSIKGCNPCT
jgi:hypothetical protein